MLYNNKEFLPTISPRLFPKNSVQRRIWNPLKYLQWSFFPNIITKNRQVFSQKSSIADVRLGSKYASDKETIF